MIEAAEIRPVSSELALFAGSYLFETENKTINFCVNKPCVSLDNDGNAHMDDEDEEEWGVFINETVDLVSLSQDDSFITLIKDKLYELFSLSKENLSSICGGSVYAQGNSCVALDCSSELLTEMSNRGLTIT